MKIKATGRLGGGASRRRSRLGEEGGEAAAATDHRVLVWDLAEVSELFPHRPELVRVLPQLLGPVQVPYGDEHVVSSLEKKQRRECVSVQKAAPHQRRFSEGY